MTTRFKFTKAALEALRVPPKGKRLVVYDTKIPKLAFRVTDADGRSFWIIKHVGHEVVWHRLGAFDEMTIEQARKAADKTLGEFADGKNPAKARREARAEMNFGEAFELYMSRHVEARGVKRGGDLRQMWERCLGEMPDKPKKKHAPKDRSKHPGGVDWQHRKLSQITRDDAAMLHSAIGKTHPTLANRVIELASAICNRLHQWGFDVPNPFARIEPFREQKRDRFLQSLELPRFFAALAANTSNDFRDFVILALMTGGRRKNVLEMQWTDVNFERAVWRIPAAQSKNAEPVDVPIVPEAVAILTARKAAQTDGDGTKSPFVFPAASASGHCAHR